MCANPDLNIIARSNGFEILTPKEPIPRTPRARTVNQHAAQADSYNDGGPVRKIKVNEDDQDDSSESEDEDIEEDLDDFKETNEDQGYESRPINYKAVTTASRTSKTTARDSRWKHNLEDVIRPSADGRNLKVTQKKKVELTWMLKPVRAK